MQILLKLSECLLCYAKCICAVIVKTFPKLQMMATQLQHIMHAKSKEFIRKPPRNCTKPRGKRAGTEFLSDPDHFVANQKRSSLFQPVFLCLSAWYLFLTADLPLCISSQHRPWPPIITELYAVPYKYSQGDISLSPRLSVSVSLL